jgi:hypothetical protein
MSPFSPPDNLASPSELSIQQTGILAGADQAKHQRVDAGGVFIVAPQSSVALVCSIHHGMCVCIAFATCQCMDNLVTQSLVGSIACTSYRSHCVRDRGVVLLKHRGCRALIQEGLPLVFATDVFPVHMWCSFSKDAIRTSYVLDPKF